MKKILSFLLVMAMALMFVSCGDESKITLRVYNWGDYIDEDLLDRFEEENPDINIIYDTFDSNEAMLAKMDGGVEYDIVFPSEYMVERMIAEDKLAELDLGKVSNLGNLDERFMNMEFDPNNKYSIPYTWGTVGILYNTKHIESVDSWDVLWDPAYAGKIIMYDSVRDSMAVALKKLGYSLNTKDNDQLEEAAQLLIGQKNDGLVAAYMTDNAKSAMVGGSYAMAVVYSGDAIVCMEENEDLAYAVPKEGSNIWTDNICITKTCQNTDAAYKFINFLCDAEVAKVNAEFIGYSTPNKAALQLLGEEWIEDEVFNPADATVEHCEVFVDLGDYVSVYNDIWQRVKLD